MAAPLSDGLGQCSFWKSVRYDIVKELKATFASSDINRQIWKILIVIAPFSFLVHAISTIVVLLAFRRIGNQPRSKGTKVYIWTVALLISDCVTLYVGVLKSIGYGIRLNERLTAFAGTLAAAVCATASHLILMSMTIDRSLAILAPIWYRNGQSSNRCRFWTAIGPILFISVSVGFGAFWNPQDPNYKPRSRNYGYDLFSYYYRSENGGRRWEPGYSRFHPISCRRLVSGFQRHFHSGFNDSQKGSNYQAYGLHHKAYLNRLHEAYTGGLPRAYIHRPEVHHKFVNDLLLYKPLTCTLVGDNPKRHRELAARLAVGRKILRLLDQHAQFDDLGPTFNKDQRSSSSDSRLKRRNENVSRISTFSRTNHGLKLTWRKWRSLTQKHLLFHWYWIEAGHSEPVRPFIGSDKSLKSDERMTRLAFESLRLESADLRKRNNCIGRADAAYRPPINDADENQTLASIKINKTNAFFEKILAVVDNNTTRRQIKEGGDIPPRLRHNRFRLCVKEEMTCVEQLHRCGCFLSTKLTKNWNLQRGLAFTSFLALIFLVLAVGSVIILHHLRQEIVKERQREEDARKAAKNIKRNTAEQAGIRRNQTALTQTSRAKKSQLVATWLTIFELVLAFCQLLTLSVLTLKRWMYRYNYLVLDRSIDAILGVLYFIQYSTSSLVALSLSGDLRNNVREMLRLNK